MQFFINRENYNFFQDILSMWYVQGNKLLEKKAIRIVKNYHAKLEEIWSSEKKNDSNKN